MRSTPGLQRTKSVVTLFGCYAICQGFSTATARSGDPMVRAVSVRDVGFPASASAGGYSALPSLSRDGRFVAFVSSGQNLAPGDVNGGGLDVYVRDRAAGRTVLVSVSTDGQHSGTDASFAPAISADGRWVAFESRAANLVANAVTGAGDVYIRDLETGVTRLISVNLTGTGGGFGASGEPELTPDARFVVFSSAAPNLVVNDTNRATDVFVRDLQTGKTSLASINLQGTGSASVPDADARGSGNAVISDDGRFVAFESRSSDLAPSDQNGATDVFVRDLQRGTTLLASVNTNGASSLSGASTTPLLSADGRYVVFTSTGADLAPGSVAGLPAVYRRDLQTSTTVRVSPPPGISSGDAFEPALSRDGRYVVFTCWNIPDARSEVRLWDADTGSSFVVSQNTLGEPAIGANGAPQISADGEVVAFLSDATDLVGGNTYGRLQVFWREIRTGVTRLASSPSLEGTRGSRADCLYPTLSANGAVVAFLASDGELVPDDLNHELDVFVRAGETAAVELISSADPALAPLTGNGASSLAGRGLSADGRYVLYSSLAPDLVTLDTNLTYDVFLRDLTAGANILISANPQTGRPADGASHDPVMTPDGQHVLFFSRALDLFGPDTNRLDDLYLRDVVSGNVALVSLSLDGTLPGGVDTLPPAVSASGRYVAFASRTLESPPRYGRTQLYLRDMVAQTTVKVAPVSATSPANAAPQPLAFVGDTSLLLTEGAYAYVYRYDIASQTTELIALDLPTSPLAVQVTAAITPEGLYAAFQVPRFPSEGQLKQRLSRYDFATKTMVRVVDTSEPGAFTTASWSLAISADGRFVAFVSSSGSLSPRDQNGASDVYLADLDQPGLVTLVSVNRAETAAGDGASDTPSLSANGRFVAFRSASTDLVSGQDLNGAPDIFVRDLWAGVTYLASVNVDGSRSGNLRSAEPVISADGTRVAFTSFASDLVAGDFNQLGDVFVFAVPQDGMADKDTDGLPDAWELRCFGSLARNGDEDGDGDGMSDREELVAGTIPTAAWSGLRLRAEPMSEPKPVRLSWPAVAGRSYQLQFTADLGTGNWRHLPARLVSSDPVTLTALDDTTATGATGRFYRVLVMR